MKTNRALGMLCATVLLAIGCGRVGDFGEREGFSSQGPDGEGDELGGEPENGGEQSETCHDGVVQPGEVCQAQEPTTIPAGIDPCSLSIADLDGDGRPDLAVPNSDPWVTPGGTHVSNVLRGYGNGDFAKAVPYPSGEELPVGLAVGDFDGDGRPDIATANHEARQAFLLRNMGGGMSFAPPTGVGVESTASSIAAGDFNNDGLDDLIVNTPSGVALLRGTPSGLLHTDTLDVGGTPMHSELVDLDNDGNLDLVAAVTANADGPGRLVILQGGGDGSFPERVEHPLPGDPWWVVAGDLNMDGDLDLLVANYSVNKVSILLGNSLGGFSETTDINVCLGPQSVAIGDMNNDGANDFVVGCMDSDRVQLWLQVEGGEFELTRWWGTGSRPVSVQVADLNLDGVPDIAWANQFGNTVGVVLSQP